MYPLQRKKIGFFLKDLNNSEISYNILKYGGDCNFDVIAFFENISQPCIQSLVPYMHFSEAYIFDGPIIATCLSTASRLINLFTPSPKFFFINDLEWLRIPYQMKQYEMFANIYRNMDLSLICRCEEHKKIIESCWNRKVDYIVEGYQFFTNEFMTPILKQSHGLYDKYTKYLDKLLSFQNSVSEYIMS